MCKAVKAIIFSFIFSSFNRTISRSLRASFHSTSAQSEYKEERGKEDEVGREEEMSS